MGGVRVLPELKTVQKYGHKKDAGEARVATRETVGRWEMGAF